MNAHATDRTEVPPRKTWTYRKDVHPTHQSDSKAARFGRLVQLQPELLGVLVRAARGEISDPERAVSILVGPLTTYRFRDGRTGTVRPEDITHGRFEIVQGDPELTSQDAFDLAADVVRRAMPVQKQQMAA